MREHRFVPVDRLQHQEVGDFRRGATPGRGDAPAKRFPALMKETEQLGHERGQPARGAGVEHGRNERVLQHDALVRAAFDNLRERDGRVRFTDFALEQEPRPEGADFNLRGRRRRHRRVAGLDLADLVARELVRARRSIHLDAARTP
jgi:hypothetical protein